MELVAISREQRIDSPEVFEEWRVTGDPGPGFPPYDFVFSPDRNPHLGDPEQAARKFVAMLCDRSASWMDGPHLSRRLVHRTRWEPVDPVNVER